MGMIERFEDIEAWKDARTLVKRIYEVTREGGFTRDFAQRDQIRRGAVSTMSNIAEGFERGSDKDFIRFLYMAKASAGEVRSQLYVALDLGYWVEEQANRLSELVETVSRQIAGFVRYLESANREVRRKVPRAMRRSDAAP